MAVLYFDSFDHFTTAQLTTKWNAQLGSGEFLPPEVTTNAGRKGYGLATWKGGQAWKSFVDSATVSVGFAWRPMGIANKRIMALRDEETIQVYLQLSEASRIQIFRGNGQLIGTGSQAISPAKFYHIELRVVLGSTTGEVTLRINGDAALGFSATNVSTQVSSFARVNILTLGDPSNSPIYFHYDDVFITDGNLIGPQFVDVLRPNGNVPGYMDMSAVGGAGSLYERINDITPDGDTSYLYSAAAAVGGVHYSEFEDIRDVTGGAIHALAVHTFARKEYGNTRMFYTGMYPGTYDGASGTMQYYNFDPLSIENDYCYQSNYYDNNPGTGGTWSVGSVNALKAGFLRYV